MAYTCFSVLHQWNRSIVLLFTIVVMRATHELHAAIICPFSLLYNIPLNTIFILSSGDGHFGLFLIFIYNKYYDTKHSCYLFFGEHVHVFLFSIYLGVELLKEYAFVQL